MTATATISKQAAPGNVASPAQLPAALLRRFFARLIAGRDSALNLAICRIAVLATLLNYIDIETIACLSTVPTILWTIPRNATLIFHLVPLTPGTALAAAWICKAACIFGIVGMRSRIAAGVAALTGLYAMIVAHLAFPAPHTHHLLWFASILAFSRCGDALSIDSLVDAKRQAANNGIKTVERSNQYGLPLRIIWLLFGVIYFFPGLQKILHGGTEWIFVSGLRHVLRFKWLVMGGWHPPFRVDQFPLVCSTATVFVVLFELSFFALVMRRRTRMIAASLGLLFHNSVGYFMRVPFFQLQGCYPALFDWQMLGDHAGKRLFGNRLRVRLDASCAQCRNIVGAARSFDLFRRVSFSSAHAHADLDLHAASSTPQTDTFPGLIPLFKRIPLLWFVFPVLTGRHDAVSTSCAGDRSTHGAAPTGYRSKRDAECGSKRDAECGSKRDAEYRSTRQRNVVALSVLGVILIGMNCLFGVFGKEGGWPFACYPIFTIKAETATSLRLDLRFGDRETTVDLDQTWPFLSRYKNTQWRFFWPSLMSSRPEKRDKQLHAIWLLLTKEHPQWKTASSARFYHETFSTDPADAGKVKESVLVWEESN